jgi:hypothetical protein
MPQWIFLLPWRKTGGCSNSANCSHTSRTPAADQHGGMNLPINTQREFPLSGGQLSAPTIYFHISPAYGISAQVTRVTSTSIPQKDAGLR